MCVVVFVQIAEHVHKRAPLILRTLLIIRFTSEHYNDNFTLAGNKNTLSVVFITCMHTA